VSESRRIARITFDERTGLRRSPEVEQERKVAIFDLLEGNSFALVNGDPGPYELRLGIRENRLVMEVRDEAGRALRTIVLALGSFRRLIKDYFTVCDSYYQAIKTAPPSRIETIDMGRRGLHDQGSTLLIERLAGKVELDFDTARRLFTLICVLHIRG